MENILHTSYSYYMEEKGRKTLRSLELSASAGEAVYLYGNPKRCLRNFQILCGLRKPDLGNVCFRCQDIYALPKHKEIPFRRDHIGAIPKGGGLIPEVPMLSQVILPMKLTGADWETIRHRVETLISDRMPLHSLYNLPGQCNTRKQAYAAIFRSVIRSPEVLILDGFLDDYEELDADLLWETLLSLRPKGSVLIYLSSAPAPEYVTWTQQLKL